MRAMTGTLLAIFGLSSGLAGCAITSLGGQRMTPRSDEFAAYVEAVFRRQNEIATELALVLDSEAPESERMASLEAAELGLLAACRGLNEIAARRRDGESVRGLGVLKRARRAPDCERATAAAAALL